MNDPSNNNNHPTMEPARSQDRREAELEELRKKQLAKSRQIEDTGSGQTVGMESWYEQQRQQNKLIRLQQKDATENLRNYKSIDATASSSTSVVGNTKDQIKQKEQEATEMLRNYRGRPQDFMTHQVKKHAKNDGNTNNINKNVVQADVVAPNPKQKQLDTVEGTFNPLSMYNNNEMDGNSSQSDRGRSASQGTNDWSVISGNESNGSDSTAVNVDISEITGILSNGPDAAAGVVSNLNRSGHDTPSSASYVNLDVSGGEMEKITTKQKQKQIMKLTNITASFGLLMHENETPPEGSFSSPIQNDVVDNLLYKMRLIAERALETCPTASVARQEESPIQIKIVKDASYSAPENRPGVLRNLVKATIPIKTERDDLQGVANAKILVHNTLRKSLADLTSRS